MVSAIGGNRAVQQPIPPLFGIIQQRQRSKDQFRDRCESDTRRNATPLHNTQGKPVNDTLNPSAIPAAIPPGAAIGIIAGSGRFPFLVAQGARQAGLKVFICGFEGNADPALAGEADAFTLLNLGQLGGLINFFKQHKVGRVCMAGAISKPKALSLRPDLRAAKVLFRLASRAKGDDVILRAVAEELESEGIAVVRPDALSPSLLAPEGVLGKKKPSPEEWADIRFGWGIAKTLGSLDIGQSVIVKKGIVIAVEAIEGTDAALERGGRLGGAGCTLVKAVKPGQDERLDLPSLGKTTLELLASHNYACLAFEAGRTLFFDLEAAVKAADTAGIAVVGVPSEAEAFFREVAE